MRRSPPGVVKVAASTPPFDGFGVDAEFLRELTDSVRPWHRFVANCYLLLVKDSEFKNSYKPPLTEPPVIERGLMSDTRCASCMPLRTSIETGRIHVGQFVSLLDGRLTLYWLETIPC